MGHEGLSHVKNQPSLRLRIRGKGVVRGIFKIKRRNSVQKEIIVIPFKKAELDWIKNSPIPAHAVRAWG